jgi:hypothetical protein
MSAVSLSRLWLPLSLAVLAVGQTRIDLQRQARNGVIPAGPTLPASCTSGSFFFLEDGPNGGSLYACTTGGGWLQQALPAPPSGSNGTTALALGNDGAMASWQEINGDVSGSVWQPRVVGLRNRPVADMAPLPGQGLVWDGQTWKPDYVTTAGQGRMTIRSGAVEFANTGILKFVPGVGLLMNLTHSNGETQVQPEPDTSVLVTQTLLRNQQPVNCSSPEQQTAEFTCDLNPVLPGYAAGLSLNWKMATTPAGGPMTLSVNQLAAQAIKLEDGVSDPVAGDLRAGALYRLWHDGTVFRVLNPSGFSALAPEGQTRPVCAAALRGRFWHRPGGVGEKDEVAVCAKNDADAYDWRLLY